jgi:hypothetical protein
LYECEVVGRGLHLNPELALALFIAPVLLDAAYDTSLRDLQRHWGPVASLVVIAVGLTTLAVAFVVHSLVPSIPWAAAIRRALRTPNYGPRRFLPIGARMKRGSHGIPISPEKYLYVWGRVTYADGFGERRFVDFCHRYNTEMKETPPGGGYRIRTEHARYHDFGNRAD